MNKLAISAGLIVLVAAMLPRLVEAQELPYAGFELQQFPTIVWEAADKQPHTMFPDYDETVLASTSYFEQPDSRELSEGVLTVETSRDCSLSMIYYSPVGMAYVIRSGLPAPARSSITSTFVLPVKEDAGLTRLLLWKEGFDEGWLALLARHPLQDLEPVPGMLAEAWFGRQQPGSYRRPWEDQYRPPSIYRADYQLGSIPYSVARLGADGRLAAKNCSVEGSAPVRLTSDEYGAFGTWELDWSSRLYITTEFPPQGVPSSAYLVVYGSSGQAFGVASLPAVEISVNGWSVIPSLHISPFEVALQPIALDVSQYVEAGTNRISLQLGALADKIWKVSRIEIWID